MGERRAGLRRVGFRRSGSAEASGGSGAVGWTNDVALRMADALAIDPADAVVMADDFVAPGGTSFGPNWTRTATANVSHAAAGGAAWQSGVCVIEEQSTSWSDNSLESAGPGLTKGVVTDLWGIAFRIYRNVAPAANVFNLGLWGVHGTSAGRFVYFGVDESTDATHLCMGATATTGVVSNYLASGLDAGFVEAMILTFPLAGVQTSVAYIDGTEIARLNPAANDLYRPYFYANKGLYVFDAVAMVVPGSIP